MVSIFSNCGGIFVHVQNIKVFTGPYPSVFS